MAETMLSPHLHSFLQSDMWRSFRETQGWKSHRIDSILILERPLPLGKSFFYSPEVTGDTNQLSELVGQVRQLAKKRQAIFYRLELLIDKTNHIAEAWQKELERAQFTKAFESVQPDDRQIVDISRDEAQILAHMKPKGRYNIRVAEKSDVTIRQATEASLKEDVAIFYSLFEQTAKRDTFSIRSQDYFLSLCQLLYQENAGQLFIATYQNQPLAALILTLHDGLAAYLYGASSNENRQVMAPYLIHWHAMQWAKSKGAGLYDLLAISPDDSQDHPYAGITRFKQQFGGESVHVLGSWDLVLQPTWYALFKWGEQLRR